MGGILGLAAVIETIARSAGSADGGLFVLVLCLLAMAGTLPLALPGPATAALVVSAANLLSIMPFHALTIAGVAAKVIAAYRLGRAGPEALALGLTVPFLLLALTGPWTGTLTVAVAVLTPTERWPARPSVGAKTPGNTTPPARTLSERCWRTPPEGNAPASPGNCMTLSPIMSR